MRSACIGFLLLVLAGCATAPKGVLQGEEPVSPAFVAEDALAPEIAIKALSLVGLPYRYGGADPQTGFDCSGLVRHVYHRVAGVALPFDAKGMSALGRSVDVGELQPGDLVFFNTLRRPYSHVGIYIGERRFVHAPSAGGVVEVVNMAARYWRERYNGARRLRL